MHKNPLHCPSPPPPRPCATPPLWPQLPLTQRRQCHDLITQLVLSVIHSERSKEKSHERQD
jgi:hypothetical protein